MDSKKRRRITRRISPQSQQAEDTADDEAELCNLRAGPGKPVGRLMEDGALQAAAENAGADEFGQVWKGKRNEAHHKDKQ